MKNVLEYTVLKFLQSSDIMLRQIIDEFSYKQENIIVLVITGFASICAYLFDCSYMRHCGYSQTTTA